MYSEIISNFREVSVAQSSDLYVAFYRLLFDFNRFGTSKTLLKINHQQEHSHIKKESSECVDTLKNLWGYKTK